VEVVGLSRRWSPDEAPSEQPDAKTTGPPRRTPRCGLHRPRWPCRRKSDDDRGGDNEGDTAKDMLDFFCCLGRRGARVSASPLLGW